MAELKVVEGSKKDPILSSETTDMALFVRTSGDEWCLSDLCVRSITRRRGVARSMITALERNANRAGITISATIGSEDTALLQLARKAGFQVRQLVPPTQLALERHPRGAANA